MLSYSLKILNKKVALFGYYGWSGEPIKVIEDLLEKSGFSVINDGIRTL